MFNLSESDTSKQKSQRTHEDFLCGSAITWNTITRVKRKEKKNILEQKIGKMVHQAPGCLKFSNPPICN